MAEKTFGLRPADIVNVIFISVLLGITILFNSVIPRALLLISVYLSLLASQFIIFKFRNYNGILRFIYDLIFPIVSILILFDSLGWVVHYVNPNDIDPLLIELDYMLFGNHPTVALEGIMNPLLTDILQVAYSSYYFLPVIYGVSLLMNGQREEFDRSLFIIFFCFYLSYLGYIFMPAIGPRFTLDYLQTRELQGLLITEPMQRLLNKLEGIKRDAFPSGHTAIALTVLYLAYVYKRRLFWIFLPIVAALISSTVYCRYHYVVDVIAGILLAIFAVLSGEKILDCFPVTRNDKNCETETLLYNKR